MDSMFDVLAKLPLFQGVTRDRIAATVGMAKFHFLKFAPGETIVAAGDPCTHIRFLIAGKVRITIASADDRFRIAQTLVAPDAISPDFLFGSSTQYPGTVVAEDDQASIAQVSKNDYVKILASDHIYMYNFLNYLSMNAQKSIEGVLSMTSGSIEERIAMWVIAMTQPMAQDITITCKQRDMYAMFAVQRSSFTLALDHLVEAGAIEYKPCVITVIDRRKMLQIMRDGIE